MSDCIFCRIASGELGTPLLHQDELVVAFRDTNPQAPTHLLVVPREHLASAAELEPAHQTLWARLLSTARALAVAEGIAGSGYRLVVNVGREGGQTVAHLHLHLLGGRPMLWPPG